MVASANWALTPAGRVLLSMARVTAPVKLALRFRVTVTVPT